MMIQSFCFNLIGFTPSREVIDLADGLIGADVHILHQQHKEPSPVLFQSGHD